MPAINKIHIEAFKAFPNEFDLELNGKNLLMYGENGSGKSSIYYALHCLFQSPLKTDAGKKYFDEKDEQNLKNLDNPTADSKIWIDFTDGYPYVHELDKNGYQVKEVNGSDILLENIDGCFINHKFLFHFFNFRNSEKINLFPVFVKDILSFCKDTTSGDNLGEMYDEILSAVVKDIGDIEKFNHSVKQVVDEINLHASDIYKKYFSEEGNNEIQIRLRYDSNLDKAIDDSNEYWLKYDSVDEYVEVKGVLQLKKSPYKKLNLPFIGLELSRKESDGRFQKIEKPQSYFNEAKLTAIALSIRFSLLNLDKEADGRFLALDDMLISLDMSNRAKVVNLLLDIQDKYRIYLFTHDKMFFEYFKHKTKKTESDWAYKEMYMTDEKIPKMRDNASYLGQAYYFIKKHDYEIAGNFLRKAAEEKCKSFLPRKLTISPDYTLLDLGGLIIKCKEFAEVSGITDLTIFEDLDSFRKFILNPASHDSYDVVKYRYEIESCYHTLLQFDSIVVQPFMKPGSKLCFKLRTPEDVFNQYEFEIILCDDFRIITLPGHHPIISKGMINYRVRHNREEFGEIQSSNTTLKKFYDHTYGKSDKSIDPDFLKSIREVNSGKPICNFL